MDTECILNKYRMSQNLFADIKKGDTFNGCSLKFLDGTDLTGYTFLCQFKNTPIKPMVFEFKTEDNTITFKDNNPTLGEIIFMPRDMNYPAGVYVFDIEMTTPSGNVSTIHESAFRFNWNILQDISEKII